MEEGNFELPTSVLMLDRNEYFFPHHPEVLNVYHSFSEGNLSNYASIKEQQSLNEILANHLQLNDSQKITLAHGAEDILVKSLSWLKSRYHTVVVEDFCWNNYLHIATGFGYQIHKIPSLSSHHKFYLDLNTLNKQLTSLPPSLVLLTSPNNPTGHSVNIEILLSLVQEFPNHTFLLDMVYAPLFSINFSELFKHKNVIFIGSFSKFFGMPGLRIGFSIGDLPNAFQLNLGMQASSLLACKFALNNINWYQKNRDFMLKYANNTANIPRSNISVYHSDATFFLAKILNSNHLDSIYKNAELSSGVRPKYICKNDVHYIRFGLGPENICQKIEKYLSFFD